MRRKVRERRRESRPLCNEHCQQASSTKLSFAKPTHVESLMMVHIYMCYVAIVSFNESEVKWQVEIREQ